MSILRGADVPEYWIQIEDKAWDAAPWAVDRMTGKTLAKDPKSQMFAPVGGPGARR